MAKMSNNVASIMPTVEKSEAALFLGVSTRTLERLVFQGRLSAGRKKGKTRPVVVFERAELERFKARSEGRRLPPTRDPASGQKPKESVGFRLDSHYMRRLEEEAERQGVSAGDAARSMVIRSLEAGDEMAKLRRGLQEMFYIMLVSKMDVSEADAEDIVRRIGEVG